MSKDSTRAAAARLKDADISNNEMASLLLQAIRDNGTVVTQKLEVIENKFD